MPPPPPPPPPQQAQLPALGPNDISGIFECLQRSLSNIAAEQKAGEEALREHDSREGFCSCLAVRGRDAHIENAFFFILQ